METLNKDSTKMLKEIITYSKDTGKDCLNDLSELMHDFTGINDILKSVINDKNNYDKEIEPTEKEKHLNTLFDKLDFPFYFNDERMQNFRYSIMQVNKLLTEIEIYRARNPN